MRATPIPHLLSGARFPVVAGFLTEDAPTVYDKWGHDLSVGYACPDDAPDTELTAYVSPGHGDTDAAFLESSVGEILRRHLNARVVGHAAVTIRGHEGLRADLLIDGKNNPELRPSTILVFRVGDWFVKVRATASSASARRAVSVSAESLLQNFGWPHRPAFLQAAVAVKRAEADRAMAALGALCESLPVEGGEPDSDPAIDHDGNRNRHRTAGIRRGESLLRRGAFLHAAQQFIDLNPTGDDPELEMFERALHTFMPTDVRVARGIGTNVMDPIILDGPTNWEAWLASCFRHLEAVCGERPFEWDLEACNVVIAPTGLVDALCLRTPGGLTATVFIGIPQTGESSHGHGTVVASWRSGDGADLPVINIPDSLPEPIRDFLATHLWGHTAHWLLTRRESTTVTRPAEIPNHEDEDA